MESQSKSAHHSSWTVQINFNVAEKGNISLQSDSWSQRKVHNCRIFSSIIMCRNYNCVKRSMSDLLRLTRNKACIPKTLKLMAIINLVKT